MFFLLLFLTHSVLSQDPQKFVSGQDSCKEQSCDHSGPLVRFPFWLKGRQADGCGYPGFDLYCNSKKETVFEFQFPVSASARNVIIQARANATVQNIDYEKQVIEVNVFHGSCLPNQVPRVSASASRFELTDENTYRSGYTLFNCSGRLEDGFSGDPIKCLEYQGFRVYPIRSSYSLSDVSSLSSCVKMYNISDVPSAFFSGSPELYPSGTHLHWLEPNCGSCESKGKRCGFKANNTNNETDCFLIQKTKHEKTIEWWKKVIIAVAAVVTFLMMVVLAVLCTIYLKKKRKLENQRKIIRFLEDYEALRPTRYSYSDIKRITEGFKHKLGRGGYGTVFKGMLSSEIPVAVKILNNIKGHGDDFINEVRTIGSIHHVNVVRLIGYCADGYRRALVYEFLENDSLQKYIVLANERSKIGWEKLYKIALGIARGVEYLHQGCNQRILHFDIKPHNILLDQNLNPKVADFGLAKLCSREKSVITMTAARGTIGYIAPEVFSRNFGRVSYKSDIYSFGMVLLNMIGGRKNFSPNTIQDGSQIYFPEWMYTQLEKGEDIAFEIDKKDDVDIVKRLIIVGLWCIQWYPVDRPSMKIVIQMLEGENLPIMPPNPFAATGSEEADADADAKMASSGSSLSSAETSIGSLEIEHESKATNVPVEHEDKPTNVPPEKKKRVQWNLP